MKAPPNGAEFLIKSQLLKVTTPVSMYTVPPLHGVLPPSWYVYAVECDEVLPDKPPRNVRFENATTGNVLNGAVVRSVFESAKCRVEYPDASRTQRDAPGAAQDMERLRIKISSLVNGIVETVTTMLETALLDTAAWSSAKVDTDA